MPRRHESVTYTCEACATEFESYGTRAPRYCSRRCKDRDERRKQRAGEEYRVNRTWRYIEEEDVMG